MVQEAGGGGSAATSEELLLVQRLRDFLGMFYFSNEGTSPQDEIKVNLYRLRALFEERGQDRYVRDTRQLAYGAGDDYRFLFDDLFGREGHVERVPSSDEARRVVRNQDKQMREEASSAQPESVTDTYLTHVFAPDRAGEIPEAPAEHPALSYPEMREQLAVTSTEEGNATTSTNTGDTATGSETVADPADVVSSGGGGGGGSGVAVTLPEGATDPQYAGLPPGSQLWNIGGMIAVAYTVEEDNPESGYVYYGFPTEQAFNRAFPGEKPPIRNLTQEEADRLGGVFIGSTNLLRDDLTAGWEEGFYRGIDTNVRLQPWLEDAEVLATVLAATLEGRAVTESELESTDYFSERSDAEVAYVAFAAKADKDELEQYHLKYEDQVKEMLEKSGVRSPDPTIVQYMARKLAQGEWTPEYATRQVQALSNPYSSVTMDAGLAEVTQGVEVQNLASEAEAVRKFVRQWLGPHADNYGEEFYRSWAGAIMDDANAQDDLTAMLKKQRLALYPEYENENLSYDDIAGPWQNLMAQSWGRSAAELDSGVLDRVIRSNDRMEAERILRTEGFNRGIETVVRDVQGAMQSAFAGLGAGQVRRSL